MNPKNDRRTDYTAEELVEMGDPEFRKAVADDLFTTGHSMGPFQDRRVVDRTLLGLIDWLWWTNQKLDERAEDPSCTVELFQKTEKYRRHLLSVIDLTERRVAWLKGTKERTLQQWKKLLHEVIDAIMEGSDDEEILAIKVPSYITGNDSLDLETWYEIRREKSPSRVKDWEKEKVAA